MGVLVDPRVAVLSVVETVMAPPPPADLSLWAEKNISFGRESPVPGPYRKETIPPATRILECLGPEHPARIVSIKASAQFFKTTVAQIFIGGSMDLDPCDMGYTHPTHDNAVRWSRRKWKVMRKQSEALRRIFGESKSRDSTDTTLYQETRNGLGSLQAGGANSEASLSMVSWPKQVQDDLSKWETNEAGDPERQADNRSGAFDWAKILKISTPLFAKTCRITRNFRAGTQERWHVPCPHCDHYQPLEWNNFLGTLDREHPEAAHFTCVSCNGKIEHRHKTSIVARGCWVADNPSGKEPSFHIWRAYSPFRDWESIAREWFTSEGNPSSEQTFFNDVLGLEFERASEAPPWEEIRNRSNGIDAEGKVLADASVYDRGRIPAGALLFCAGVDCQGDRTEVHLKGFGASLRRWTVDYLVIPHHIATQEARDELDKLLKNAWPDEFGNRRGLDMLAIDGNAWTNDVFGWARERKHSWTRVIIVRGAKSDHAPPLALTKTERKADGKTRRAQKRFYNVGVSGLKSSFYEHLKKVDPLSRGYCGYPRGLEDDFFRQATAERREVTTDRWGFPRAAWIKDYERNEVLDTELYAEAAAIRCGFYTRTPEQWDALRRERETPNEAGQPDMFDPAVTVVSQAAHVAAVRPKRVVRPSAWMS
jgi:phage terminase large subunit GpA-like protein